MSDTKMFQYKQPYPVKATCVNDPADIGPTFSAFTTTVATGNEDSQITVTFASLKAQSNEADVDGTVDAFVIKAVSTGTLLIGVDAAHASAWDAVTNNTVQAMQGIYKKILVMTDQFSR